MSTVSVRIPMPLRDYTRGADEILVEAVTVRQALEVLGARHEGFLDRVLDPSGELRQFVNIFVGARNIQVLDGLATQLAKGDVISIIPAVAGGHHDRSRPMAR